MTTLYSTIAAVTSNAPFLFAAPKTVSSLDSSFDNKPSFVASTKTESYPIYQYADPVPRPTKDNSIWGLPVLYKDQVSRRRMWKIRFDSRANELITNFGLEDGKIQEDHIKVETNLSGRDIYEQAWQEARHRYNLKFRNECYRPEGQEIPQFAKPMTAYKWEPSSTRLNWEKVGYNAVQPKFDGFRCMVNLAIGCAAKTASCADQDGQCTVVEYVARSGRKLPHLNKHFDPELSQFFDYMPPNIRLDGEMFLPGVKFQELGSILRNEVIEHKNLKDVTYVIFDFDIHDPWPYDRRWHTLDNAIKRFHEDKHINTRFIICPTYKVASEAEIKEAHAVFTKKWGMEGTIIRKMIGNCTDPKIFEQTLYKSGSRSHNILKYKDWLDEEATIIGVENASGKESGKALLRVKFGNHQSKTGDSQSGAEFVIRFGSYAEREAWFNNPALVIGKQITVVYKELTKDGKPREPEGKAFREADE